MNDQAVNETPNAESPQTPAAEAVAQEPDLDSLLAEYDHVPAQTPTVETPQVAPDVDPTVQNFMDRQMKKENDLAIGEAAKVMHDSIEGTNLSAKWFEAQLYMAGAKDPRVTQAFDDRDNNPGRWEAIVKGLGKELAGDFVKTDGPSTESWNAVDAAVHSSSTTTPTTKPEVTSKDLRKMSNTEFAAYKKEQGFSR